MNELNEWVRNVDGHLVMMFFFISCFLIFVVAFWPDLRYFWKKNKAKK